VWGFAEVFAAALNLELPSASTIRIPTPAGYAALKLAAWLDRSAYGKYDDASDIATVIYWYSRSQEVLDLVYESNHGQDLLIQESLDDTRATARVLGEKIAATIGTDRLVELAERWPTSRKDLLYHYMTVTNSPDWAGTSERRRELIQALERGMGIDPAS
jgi:predicted nucleotidyltransferase